DHLVGEREQLIWNIEAEPLRCLQINDQLELGRLLYRDVARLRSTKNPVHDVGGAPPQVLKVRSVGHQTSHFDVFSSTMHRRQSLDQRQGIEPTSVAAHEWVAQDIHRVDPTLESRERGREILGSSDFKYRHIQAE